MARHYAPTGAPDQIIRKLSMIPQEARRSTGVVKRFTEIDTESVAQDEAAPEALKTKLIGEVGRRAPIMAAGCFVVD
jgi:tripartite-type tricarboxylate transporter receptor subunit TctC